MNGDGTVVSYRDAEGRLRYRVERSVWDVLRYEWEAEESEDEISE